MTWEKLHRWWLAELDNDPAYRDEIEPMLIRLLAPLKGRVYLDLGCGDGRTMATLQAMGTRVVGCDLNPVLLALAARRGSVVRACLPELSWVRPSSFDGALVGLVLEHIEDESSFFLQAARAIKRGGILAMVINHPIWTAPESSPMEDASGETLWRPGTYFTRGHSDEPAGGSKVRFYHRTMSELLNAASDAGWDLRQVIECGVSNEQIARVPDYAGQEHIPRILGVRWSKR
jgi:SAM-dependent methyltransferase